MGRLMRLGNDLIRRGANALHYRFAPHAMILLYHRVVDLPFDPQLLAVSPQHFGVHLEILRRYARPISLDELATCLKDNRLPRRSVAITFDDGYSDNLQYAKPFLERYEIPATVYITAGQIGRQAEFWWDELERLLLQPGNLPKNLSLPVNGSHYRWELNGSSEYSEEDHQRDRDWHIERPDDPSPRHRLYRSIYHLLHPMNESEKWRILESLQKWAGLDPEYRTSHRTLTVDQVAFLEKGGLVDVGAHTMTHPRLASLTAERQREEIVQSKTCLEEILDRPVNSFAYPHGSYTDETISLVQEAGFNHACSSDTDAVWGGAHPFRLPRVGVRDWDGEEFTRWIKGWLGI